MKFLNTKILSTKDHQNWNSKLDSIQTLQKKVFFSISKRENKRNVKDHTFDIKNDSIVVHIALCTSSTISPHYEHPKKVTGDDNRSKWE